MYPKNITPLNAVYKSSGKIKIIKKISYHKFLWK
jgi:hypothetical protein